MNWVLLVGAAQNIAGAAVIAISAAQSVRRSGQPDDYVQLKLFAAGTAFTFGAMYLYLFSHEKQVIPFLLFGAALKTWAFALSAALFGIGRLPLRQFIEFGCSNGAVATLFWAYVSVTI